MKKNMESGRSMIEMLGVLAIVGVLTVGGFSLVSKATTENKINQAIDEVSSLAQKTRSIFREYVVIQKPTEKVDITDYIFKAKAFPDVLAYNNSSKVFENNEEVKMKIIHDVASGVDLHYFILELSDLNEDVCMGLVNAQWGTAASNGFIGMSFSETGTYTRTIDLGVATSSCDETSSQKPKLYLKFK